MRRLTVDDVFGVITVSLVVAILSVVALAFIPIGHLLVPGIEPWAPIQQMPWHPMLLSSHYHALDTMQTDHQGYVTACTAPLSPGSASTLTVPLHNSDPRSNWQMANTKLDLKSVVLTGVGPDNGTIIPSYADANTVRLECARDVPVPKPCTSLQFNTRIVDGVRFARRPGVETSSWPPFSRGPRRANCRLYLTTSNPLAVYARACAEFRVHTRRVAWWHDFGAISVSLGLASIWSVVLCMMTLACGGCQGSAPPRASSTPVVQAKPKAE